MRLIHEVIGSRRVLCVICMSLLGLAGSWASAGWNYEQVDSGGGEYTSLLMVGDIPHISYATPTRLKYAWFDNTLGWQSEDVIASRRIFPSLAMDGGMPVISYYKPGDEDLCLGSRNYQGPMGHPWSAEVILTGGDVGKYNSLKVDGAGDYHLSFYNDTQGNLRYGKRSGTPSSWVWQTVDSTGDTGKHTSLALDGTMPHISYVDATNGTLRHAEYNGGGWDKETISGTSDVDGAATSIVRDNDGDFHISFAHLGDDTDTWLRYATDTSGSFVAENAVWSDPCYFNSIAVDSQDCPIIAYHDSYHGKLFVAWEDTSGTWHSELVDDGLRDAGPHNVGAYCSIGLDTQERVHISYWDMSADVLMHTWSNTPIPEPASASILLLGAVAMLRRKRNG